MNPFLADENFNNRYIRALRRRLPSIDILRLQDVGLLHADDPTILDWAANEQRIVLTHDVNTMPDHVKARLDQGCLSSESFWRSRGLLSRS